MIKKPITIHLSTGLEARHAAWQRAKLPRMRLGVPDGSPLAAEMDAILKEGN